jgi:hypothetical protein
VARDSVPPSCVGLSGAGLMFGFVMAANQCIKAERESAGNTRRAPDHPERGALKMATPLSSKICSSCKLAKPINCFGVRPEYRDGYRNQCNSCRTQSTAKYLKTEVGSKLAAANRERKKQSNPPDSERWRKLQIKYGVSRSLYESLVIKQDGKCAVCRSSDPRNNRGVLVVDHCHDTGRIRGLLCTPCNTAIGNLGDTLEGIEAAARYLRGAA